MRTKLVMLLSVLARVGSTAGTSTAEGEGPSARRQVVVPHATTPRIAELAGFAIHSTGTNQCLAADGTAVVLADCAYEPRQRWYFHDLGDANYLIQNGGGGVLAADPATNCCNGTALRLSEHVPGDTHQEWLYWDDDTRLGFQNNYSYRNLAAGDDEVRLWDYRREDTAQHWRLELAE
jgi:hypothetical protein